MGDHKSGFSFYTGPHEVLSRSGRRTLVVHSAGGAVLRRNHGRLEVLLIKRSGRSSYELPKGHLEAGESPREAAAREIREETGLHRDFHVTSRVVGREQVASGAGSRRYERIWKGDVTKEVVYYLAVVTDAQGDDDQEADGFTSCEVETCHRQWVEQEETLGILFKTEGMKTATQEAFAAFAPESSALLSSDSDEQAGNQMQNEQCLRTT
ncbi:MAG: hypothetical protein KVP17_004650 [Porospora cf. gigantea B]|uniref:uncharacterized protein n=1 Tax=Porospora cf. gigantea B TaxID=2853592 RepID=UPI003571B573|nr:MAG: hypothetical protein KVP17_004650 [Porospora cf. gigantea B]